MAKKSKNVKNRNQASIPLQLYIDPGDASVETIKNVLLALNNLYVASGGDGLVFEEKEQFEFEAMRAIA